MVEGQNLDLNLRRTDRAGYEDYFECTSKKTGAFLALATVGGGLIGGATDTNLRRLHEFGRLSGVSFQIRDDLLDVNSDKGRTPGSDILEGKRTLMVVHASRQASPSDRRRLYAILNKPRESTSSTDVTWVWRLFRRTRADEYAARTAADLEGGDDGVAPVGVDVDDRCGKVAQRRAPGAAGKDRRQRLLLQCGRAVVHVQAHTPRFARLVVAIGPGQHDVEIRQIEVTGAAGDDPP